MYANPLRKPWLTSDLDPVCSAVLRGQCHEVPPVLKRLHMDVRTTSLDFNVIEPITKDNYPGETTI